MIISESLVKLLDILKEKTLTKEVFWNEIKPNGYLVKFKSGKILLHGIDFYSTKKEISISIFDQSDDVLDTYLIEKSKNEEEYLYLFDLQSNIRYVVNNVDAIISSMIKELESKK